MTDAGPGTVPATTARVEVWWAAASSDPGLDRMIDPIERGRAAGMDPGPRAGFVTARALMRCVLSQRTGLLPAEVPLSATCPRCGGPHGKPSVALGPPHPPLGVSLAHAGEMVVVAVADTGDVGVDAEAVQAVARLGARDADLLAAEALAPDERVLWSAGGRVPADLARWWTRKEAVLKACGHGLAVRPASVRVSPPWAPPALVAWDATEPLDGVVSLVDLGAVPGYVGSVAVLGASAAHVAERDGDEVLAAG